MTRQAASVAIVVGGASGIGHATAALLAMDPGWRVTVADLRGADEAARSVNSLGNVRGAALDVTSSAEVDAFFHEVGTAEGKIDALVNCAGITGPMPSGSITDASWDALIDVHLGGTMRCARAAFPWLRASGAASVVSTSSIGASVGVPARAAYSAAKGGIEALTRVLAVEWAASGIRVNAVAPGFTRTALVAESIEKKLYDISSVLDRVPLKRMAEPIEIARVIAFLCRAESSYVTGQTIIVDGGFLVSGELGQSSRGDAS